ncbi:MAG: hypothetical protein ACT4QG_16995 [Sporichthyaceae bacterium]
MSMDRATAVVVAGKRQPARPSSAATAAGQLLALLDEPAEHPLRPSEVALLQDWLRQLAAARP